MEDQVWWRLYHLVNSVGQTHSRYRKQFSDSWIALVFLWSVLHDRPRCWACQEENWDQSHLQGRDLPSRRTLARRLNSLSVQQLLQQVQNALREQFPRSPLKWIDSKPLPVGNSTKDREAGYGRCAGGKSRGYKLHGLWDGAGRVLDDWRLAAMSVNDKRVARELLPELQHAYYLVADNQYDGNELYDLVAQQGTQLLTQPRHTQPQALGHRRQSPGRLRSLSLAQNPLAPSGPPRSFGQDLLHSRTEVERRYGLLGNFAGGLGPLPNWVRTPRRVALWVQMKLLIFLTREAIRQRLAA
jgi:Transposase DDE domain